MRTVRPGLALLVLLLAMPAPGGAQRLKDLLYDPGPLPPVDSRLKVRPGETAPDFVLPSIRREKIRLSSFRGRLNVVLSFVPAAFTPVCSDQWPGYHLARPLFEEHEATLLGIAVDNLPALHAWTREMGDLWFPVLSDFWPHGKVASRYGLLRRDGTAERALVFIDKKGIIRDILVSDINNRSPLEQVAAALKKFGKR